MSLPSICTKAARRLIALILMAAASSAGAQLLDVEKALMPGQVIRGHAKYEHQCEQCHRRFDKAAQSRLCADCHKDVAADLRGRRGLHGRLKDSTCRTCHTDHKGRGAKIAVVDKNTFDHARTDFKLRGAHRKTPDKCDSCHKAGRKYRDAPSDCFSCHRRDDEDKGHRGRLGKKCDTCHNEVKWTEIRFDHDKTRFRLDGEHVAVTCKECHRQNKYKDTPRDCYSCHKKDDADDGHHGQFGRKCEKCHVTAGWRQPVFDHDRDTHYRLKGKHLRTECTACHTGPLFKEKPKRQCLACHRKDDEEKGHRGSLGRKCETCHDEQAWKTTRFDHDKDTKYPLEGKHRTAKCDSCHKSGLKPAPGAKKIEKLPTKCAECHRKEDKEKGHKGKFGDKCETCHTPRDWKKSIFDHDRDTEYRLRRKHREAKCKDCHTVQLYVEKTATTCISCHRKDDKEKGHKGTLGERCDTCHQEGEGDWKVDKFDHKRSRFPLAGSHERVKCKECHKNADFRSTPRECYGCHQKDDADKDKGHKGRFGTRCETCHNDRIWKSWDFDHGKTRFPLSGGHKKAGCYDCHKTAIKGRPRIGRACADCHLEDDVHDGGFGNQCEICHVADNWRDIRR